MLPIISYPAKTFNQRPDNTIINTLIIHYTACDLEFSLKILSGNFPPHPVSCHYLIDENGDIYQLVSEQDRAWHVATGKGFWRGEDNINNVSIGIELVNPGLGEDYRHFPPSQMKSLLDLSHGILERHPIESPHVLGHSDVDPLRKTDPGYLFDWSVLAQEGIGVMPPPIDDKTPRDCYDWKIIRSMLENYGYRVEEGEEGDPLIRKVINAFAMHFCPHLYQSQDIQRIDRCLKKVCESQLLLSSIPQSS